MPATIGAEVFNRPVVNRVIFQIRFPSLFYMDNIVGQLQLRLLPRFPDSDLQLQRPFVFGHGSEEGIRKAFEESPSEAEVIRVWSFRSANDVIVEIKQGAVTISSQSHKSYKSAATGNFRTEIEFVLGHFLELASLPKINRVGLRYIDKCPVHSDDPDEFRRFYNTLLPLSRFDFRQSQKLHLEAVTEMDAKMVRLIETFIRTDAGGSNYTLDFDAWKLNVNATAIIDVADELHLLIRRQFEQCINEPLIEWMRGEK